MRGTVEPRFTEPLYNEVLGITNDFLYPSNSKIYEKGPRYNETLGIILCQSLGPSLFRGSTVYFRPGAYSGPWV